MTFTMEREAPLPVWIESINIDMDGIPESDSMVALLMDMDGDLLPSNPKVGNSTTHSIEQYSPSNHLLDVAPMVDTNLKDIEATPKRPKKDRTMPTLNPVKDKTTTRATRQVDPFGRDQRRKNKQRGYETNYRKRQKGRRDNDQVEWVQLEIQLREMLAKRTSVVVGGSSEMLEMGTSASIRQRYLELLQEERALRESMALDNCWWAETQALTFWGGANSKTRDIREKINTLPSLRRCHTFDFSW
uniref:BZIP domain-containing protein n=1 Tax=Peronospora matthiolae TaxID=2874970 RepID=A0AAV1U5M1_9STRA